MQGKRLERTKIACFAFVWAAIAVCDILILFPWHG